MKKVIYLVLFFVLCTLSDSYGQISMAANMANTIMEQYKDSLVVKKYINHLMEEELLRNKVSKKDIEKDNQRPANWNYEIGVVLTGFDRLWRSTGDPSYLKYAKNIIDHFISKDGIIRTYTLEDYNVDNIPTGRILLSLYQVYKDEKYLKAAKTLKYQLDFQPRTKEGGYWHKLRYPYQMWLDGLYMGQPFRAEYLSLMNKNDEWDDVADQFLWMAKGSMDHKTGLLYHAFDESKVQRWSNPKNGQSHEFWSRAMGWYILGLIDVIEIFPNTNPKKKELVTTFVNLSEALIKVQDPSSGVWWQVTDKAFQKNNYLESSGSSMFVAAMLKALRLGYLPEKFKVNAMKGYEGILKEFVSKDKDCLYHLNDAVSGAGLGGSPYRDGSYEYYVNEPKRNDDLKAIGPFMQAAIEYELAGMQDIGKGKMVLLDRYYNNEYKDGKRYHYTWDDKNDSGFSWLGNIYRDHGATIDHLDSAPTIQNLANSKVYIIVDPDNFKDNPTPHALVTEESSAIVAWVNNGGTLIVMGNDTANANIGQFNPLLQTFGISFTNKNINFVKNNNFIEGDVNTDMKSEIFAPGLKLYVKELATLKVKKSVTIHAKKGKDVVMASAKYGKGSVFVIGDPWLYNEYVNGRKLPATYDNFSAASQLVKWSLR